MAFSFWDFFCEHADCISHMRTMHKLIGTATWSRMHATWNVYGRDIVPAILRPILSAALTRLDVSLKCDSVETNIEIEDLMLEPLPETKGN